MGFTGEGMEIALGVGYRESWSTRDGQGGYYDAVGDVDLVDDTWGPSCGWFQIRSLFDPFSYSVKDRYRMAFACMNPWFCASAAYVISDGGTNWEPWSAYKSGSYLENKGMDYQLRSGHERADKWILGVKR